MSKHICIYLALIVCAGAISGQDTVEAELSPAGEAVVRAAIVRREDVETPSHKIDSAAEVFAHVAAEIETTTTTGAGWAAQFANISASSPAQKAANNMAIASFMMLGGSMLFYMMCFYFVSSADKDIEMSTWKVLSGALSLGCTTLLFQAWRLLMFLCSSQAPLAPNMIILFSFTRWMTSMIVIPWIIMRAWYNPVGLAAASQLGGNFIGFAALEALGGAMTMSPWNTNAGFYFLGIQVYAIVYIVWMVICSLIRGKLYAKDMWHYSEELLPWKKKVEEAEDQGFGLCIGMLLSILIRYGISNTIPDLAGTPAFRSPTEIHILMVAALVSAFVTVFVAGALTYLKQPEWGNIAYRFANCTTLSLEMCTAWLVFYFFQWRFWWSAHVTGTVGGDEIDEVTAQMGVTIIASVLVFSLIFFTDKIADILMRPKDSALRELNSAFSLLLGFSWEMTIFITIKGVGLTKSTYEEECNTEMQLMLLINLVLLPVWVRVILPKLVTVEKEYDSFTDERDKVNADKRASAAALKDAEKAAKAAAAGNESNVPLVQGAPVEAAKPGSEEF